MSIYGSLLESVANTNYIDSESRLIEESFKDVMNGGPYGNDKGEFKRFLKDLFKKKKKEKSKEINKKEEKIKEMTPEEKAAFEKEVEEAYDTLLKTVEKSISKIKTTKEFKDKCIESSIKANEYLDEDEKPFKKGYIPKLMAYDFDSYSLTSYIIEVIDDCQVIAISYRWILYMIVDYIKENFQDVYNKWRFDYGDGDEGCLYVEYYKDSI